MPVTLVQEADAASSSVTLGSNATAGNALIVAVACLGSTSATGVTGVTLGGSADNFTPITPGPSAQDTTSPNDFINVSVWADPNCAGGSTAIAITGTGVVAAWVFEFSGLSGAPETWQVFPVPTYQGSWVTALGQTTAPAQAWVAITAAANQVGAETLTVNNVTGWTVETAHAGTAGSYDWGAIAAYQAVNTVGSPAWSGEFSQSSFSVTVLVTLPAATSGALPAPAPATAFQLPPGTVATGALTVEGTLSSPAVSSPSPAAAGFAAWAYDPAMFNAIHAAALGTAGSISLIKCPVAAATSCTAVRVWVQNGGLSLTSNQNFAGIYSSTGALIATTADQSTNWASSGVMVDATLTGAPFSIKPPFVWVAVLWNGSSAPSLAATANLTAAWANGKTTAATARWGILSGPYTALPTVITPATITLTAPQFWAALW